MSFLSLVGAGPGDPELITLKAIKALGRADVILYDALVNDTLLSYGKSGAVIHFVGKRYGCHALSQQEINDLIIYYGRQHAHVVRLKGGDPFVFGRAQEEIAAAASVGMDVEMVPGISSALSVPASQMIPLTCRGVNESFWVVTGTTRSGQVSEDVRLAAQSSATIVILMAMSKLEMITEIFMSYGKSDTPAAVIMNGTRPEAKMVTGTVRDIYYRALHAEIKNPSVIVIGEVVNLNRGWLKQRVSELATNQVIERS